MISFRAYLVSGFLHRHTRVYMQEDILITRDREKDQLVQNHLLLVKNRIRYSVSVCVCECVCVCVCVCERERERERERKNVCVFVCVSKWAGILPVQLLMHLQSALATFEAKQSTKRCG